MAKKRGQKEGSIYQLPDGRWRGAVSLGWQQNEAGKVVWKRKVVTRQTREAVAREIADLLSKQASGLPVGSRPQTVGEFLAHWLENTVKPSTRPKTYRSYEQMVRNHLVKDIPPETWKAKGLDSVPGLGTLKLQKLTLQRFQQFLADKQKAGTSPSLARYLRTVMRIALGEAVRADLVPRNVAELTKPPKVEKTQQVEPLNPEQAKRLLAAAQGHRLEALFTVGLAIGLRSGEAAALRWQDIDLAAGELTVRHTLTRIKKQGLVLAPPKSETSRRTLELPDICVRALTAHRQRQEQECLFAGSRWKDTGHVFTSTIGTPLDDRRILREFVALLEAAKLPKQRFHDLRHACISLLAAQGVKDKVIAELVGHSDVRLTQRVYQHVFKAAKTDAARKMDALLTEIATEKPVATRVANEADSGRVN